MDKLNKRIGEKFSDPIFFIDTKINEIKNKTNFKDNNKKYLGLIFYISSPKLKSIHSNILKKKIYSILSKKINIYNDILGIDRIKIDSIIFLYQKIKETEAEIKNFCRGIEIDIISDISHSEIDFENSKKNIYNYQDEIEKNICYTCTMCQNLSLYHVCIIMPDRLGQCGEMSYEDAKLMYELIPFGPCKKIIFENAIDIKKGEWKEINEAVKNLTYGHTKKIYLRSALEYPAPCSPLSQTISIYGGEGEHIYILDRKNKNFNPVGISYDDALKMTAGGIQVEGITAQARKTIFEKTFLLDNGGLKNAITPYH